MRRFYQGELVKLDGDSAEPGRTGAEETGTEPASTSGTGDACLWLQKPLILSPHCC